MAFETCWLSGNFFFVNVAMEWSNRTGFTFFCLHDLNNFYYRLSPFDESFLSFFSVLIFFGQAMRRIRQLCFRFLDQIQLVKLLLPMDFQQPAALFQFLTYDILFHDVLLAEDLNATAEKLKENKQLEDKSPTLSSHIYVPWSLRLLGDQFLQEGWALVEIGYVVTAAWSELQKILESPEKITAEIDFEFVLFIARRSFTLVGSISSPKGVNFKDGFKSSDKGITRMSAELSKTKSVGGKEWRTTPWGGAGSDAFIRVHKMNSTTLSSVTACLVSSVPTSSAYKSVIISGKLDNEWK